MPAAGLPAELPAGLPTGPSAEPLRVWLDLDRRYHLTVYSLGLACCAVEFGALAHADQLAHAEHPAPAEGIDAAQVLVVSGTVTEKMAPLVRGVFEAMPEPRY